MDALEEPNIISNVVLVFNKNVFKFENGGSFDESMKKLRSKLGLVKSQSKIYRYT